MFTKGTLKKKHSLKRAAACVMAAVTVIAMAGVPIRAEAWSLYDVAPLPDTLPVPENNGLHGIYIDCNKEPYRSYYKKYSNYYLDGGDCGLYAAARVYALTGVDVRPDFDGMTLIDGCKAGLEPKTHSLYFTTRLGQSNGRNDHVQVVEEVNEAENRITFSSNHDELWDQPLDEFKKLVAQRRAQYGYDDDYFGNFYFICFEDLVQAKHDRDHAQYITKTITQQPTCTEKGKAIQKCSLCGRTDTVDIPRAGHNFDSGKITKKPKKNTSGKRISWGTRDIKWGTKVYTCKTCGEKVKIPIDSVKPEKIKARQYYNGKHGMNYMECTETNTISIGKEAYYGCSKLEEIWINSLDIKSIGKDAFRGVGTKKKVEVFLPASKYEKYKQMMNAAGMGGKAEYYRVNEKDLKPNNSYYDYEL